MDSSRFQQLRGRVVGGEPARCLCLQRRGQVTVPVGLVGPDQPDEVRDRLVRVGEQFRLEGRALVVGDADLEHGRSQPGMGLQQRQPPVLLQQPHGQLLPEDRDHGLVQRVVGCLCASPKPTQAHDRETHVGR